MATTNSWNNAIAAANSAITLNSGTNQINISTDASATTVDIGTGGAAKAVTVGSTNTTSSLVLSSGSGNIASNSGLTVDSTGRTTNSAQPCFYAHKSALTSSVTGDGTQYTIIFDVANFDQNSNYNTGSGTFTAPKAGKYLFNASVYLTSLGSGHTLGSIYISVNSGNIQYQLTDINTAAVRDSNNDYQMAGSWLISLSANDTVNIVVYVLNSTKTVGVNGGTSTQYVSSTVFQGYLVC